MEDQMPANHTETPVSLDVSVKNTGEPTLFSVALAIERLSGQLDGYQARLGDQLDRTNDDLRMVRDEVGSVSIRVGQLETNGTSSRAVKRAFLAAATFGGTIIGYVVPLVVR